ncbi:hypothetical protein [Komagataeibacter melaceti]|uniref:hypothetical protein n=1 Tax=Komagataeibacter melaceti TaxID=2766577 RepID=UPI001314F6FC|nr:hypothetical protein [Komagataeibacter melaceti]
MRPTLRFIITLAAALSVAGCHHAYHDRPSHWNEGDHHDRNPNQHWGQGPHIDH